METGVDMKRDWSKTGIAIVGLLLCVLGASSVQAEERHSASARLQISVMVMPTLIAAQQAARPTPQPSLSPVTFNFQSENRNSAIYSIRNFAAGDKTATAPTSAVLKTMTIVAD